MIAWELFQKARTSWAPPHPKPNSKTLKHPKTLSKGIALRKLEIPVQDFIQEGLDSSDHNKLEGGVAVLTRNMEDEGKHDKALESIYQSLNNYDDSVNREALNVCKAWVNHPDHPITKAALLETGVFFVLLPLLRRYGTITMIEVAGWISGDERIHVQSHRQAAETLGLSPSQSLDRLRKDTVHWLTYEMDKEIKPGSCKHWLKASETLVREGVSNLTISKTFTMNAFFEISNEDLGEYV